MSGTIMPFFYSAAQQGAPVPPASLPNLNIWYDAGTGSAVNFGTVKTNDSSISKWQDISGSGHDANTNGGSGKNPTYTIPIQYGLGSVTYSSASSQNLDVNPIAWAQSLAGFTIYVAARPTSFASAFPLTVTNANLGMLWTGSAWQVGGGAGLGTVTPTNNTAKFHMYGMVFDGSQTGNANRLRFRLDKVAQTLNFGATTVGTTTSASATTFFFGGDNRTSFGFMNGYIGEVLIWTRGLSSIDINGVENYLNNRWALGL